MQHKSLSWRRILWVFAALGLLAGACGDDSTSEASSTNTSLENGEVGEPLADDDGAKPAYGGKIVVGISTETNEWSPGTGQFTLAGMTIAQTFYDPLIELDEEGEFRPFLAQAIEPNEDLTEWTLTLRDGVQFHDGTALDAEALKWNWDNLHFGENSRNRGSLNNAGVTGMEIVDDMTVKYTLSGPNAAFPDLLRGYVGFPVSPTAFEADPEGFGSNPVGTGPFQFDSWTRDDRLVVKRNENYWFTTNDGDQLPYLDEIEFRPIPDEDARTASLAANDIQVLQSVVGSSIKRVLSMTESDDYKASLFVGNDSSTTVINTLVPPLDDLRVRQALAYGNDQEAMAQVRDDDGLVPPTVGLFSEDSPWYSADAVANYPGVAGRDVEAGKALIEEYKSDPERSDGKAPGESVNISYICQPDPGVMQWAQLLQNLWGEVGIDIELIQLDEDTMISRVVGTPTSDPAFLGDFELACWRTGGGEGDPLTTLRGEFGAIETTVSNFSNLVDPGIDEALDQLQESADFDTRYAAVEEISRIVAREVPYIWNGSTPTLIGYRGDIYGIPTWTLPGGEMGTGTAGAIARFHQTFLAE